MIRTADNAPTISPAQARALYLALCTEIAAYAAEHNFEFLLFCENLAEEKTSDVAEKPRKDV